MSLLLFPPKSKVVRPEAIMHVEAVQGPNSADGEQRKFFTAFACFIQPIELEANCRAGSMLRNVIRKVCGP